MGKAMDRIHRCVEDIRTHTDFVPRAALVLGSEFVQTSCSSLTGLPQ